MATCVKNQNCFDLGKFWNIMLAYSGANTLKDCSLLISERFGKLCRRTEDLIYIQEIPTSCGRVGMYDFLFVK